MTTILVVDDQQSMRDVLSGLLQDDGYTVYTAKSPENALERWKQHGPEIDMVLTDRVMGGNAEAGFELIRKLRSEDAKCPIVMHSDCASTEVASLRAKCLEAGGTAFESKTGSSGGLLGLVEKHTRSRAR